MLFNTMSPEDLQRRSDLATKLKYGKEPVVKPEAALTGAAAKSIPFPKGLAPVPQPMTSTPDPNASLPQVDVIAMMDTGPESRAMADVLTPGVQAINWYPYTKNFEKHFVPLISPSAPARKDSHRLGSYFITMINGLKVLVYKTELHMHEDAIKLPNGSYSVPIKDMFVQMIGDAKPKVFLTTGTAGGVYCSMRLGDVVVSRAARFDCAKDFASAPFNQQTYESNWTVPATRFPQAQKLMQGFASHLTGTTDPKGTPPQSNCPCSPVTYPTDIYLDGTKDIPAFHPILTTDFFEFGTNSNNLEKIGMAVEMDDACLGLACSGMNAPPHWACVRNLSDPTINGALAQKAQESCAVYYYAKFGYWTTVMSALTTWGIIAGLGDNQ